MKLFHMPSTFGLKARLTLLIESLIVILVLITGTVSSAPITAEDTRLGTVLLGYSYRAVEKEIFKAHRQIFFLGFIISSMSKKKRPNGLPARFTMSWDRH